MTMNKDQLAAELRKQGHGRIADLLDAEPAKDDEPTIVAAREHAKVTKPQIKAAEKKRAKK